ncbi:MAG: response regulator [Lachnospiraceae bacterium]|nr:response regulator [Lachnospiraceae bacterium]
MKKQNSIVMKLIQCILGGMLVCSFLFFILGEILLPSENALENSTFHIYEGEWVQELHDGSRKPVEVPGECEAERGEWIRIITELPMDQETISFCIRSMQQELNIYVGDELRKEYSTLDTQLAGKTSTMTYVFFEVYEEDAGKELCIELMSDSNYAGYVSEIYTGERFDIQRYFYGMYAPSAIVAALMFLVAVSVLGGCAFIRIFYKKKADLVYLGGAILIAATWLLVESKLRQFFFPNSTVAMMMGFLMIAILPYPVLSYINSIQNFRYQKIYMAFGGATALNFAVVTGLQMFDVLDFFETMTSSHIIIILLIVTMTVSIVLDLVRGQIREYREVAIGFAILMLMGIFEIGMVYIVAARLNGIFLCVGFVALLVAAAMKTVRDLFNIEKEKQVAVAASESKARFLANMSHEIRTPINAVIGMNEMILRESKDEVITEYAYNIKRSSQMLLGLVNDVLDFSKIEAGKLEVVENDYDLATLLKDVVFGNQIRARKKELELKLDIDETMPAVLRGDEIRIKQILNNLLSNAIKYTEKGSVTFSAKGFWKETGFVLEFSVIDTGIGIKREDMEKLFTSFQRLELSKNRYIEGTGLGLNIAKQLTDIMNGTIEVSSEYGKGSCFTVRIPQLVVDAALMGNIERKHQGSAGQYSPGEPLKIPEAKILVVDDTKMNLFVIKELLQQTQAQLDTASGGMECLKMTKEKKYDLILMDHMMPEPDGVQTLHMIREDQDNRNQKTPVVVLTANVMAGMKEEYLKEGFSDYLPKPVEVDKLENMLAGFFLKKNAGREV